MSSTLDTTQESFVTEWAGEAEQAAATLGISANNILAQWATESGWGTNSASTTGNNPGAIAPGGTVASYSSPSAFESAYVSTIENNFPSAVNTGSNSQAFVDGLANGTEGAYYGSSDTESGYLTDVQSISTMLGASTTATSTGSNTNTGTTSTAATGTAATTEPGGTATNGVTAGWLTGLLPNVLIMALGLGMAYIGFSRTSAGGTVINMGKGAARAAVMA